MAFTAAIIGRPNVGKSTLFNRLVGRKLALVDDTPGVTRDRRVHSAKLYDLQFDVIDTAGFEDAAAATLQGRMRESWELGFGEPVPVSAEHGQGLPDLRDAVIMAIGEEKAFGEEDEEE